MTKIPTRIITILMLPSADGRGSIDTSAIASTTEGSAESGSNKNSHASMTRLLSEESEKRPRGGDRQARLGG